MSEPVAVTILEREYRVACNPDERASLIAAAGLVDARMREIRNNARTATMDRIAVMAALNIAHDFLEMRQSSTLQGSALVSEIDSVVGRLDTALANLAPR